GREPARLAARLIQGALLVAIAIIIAAGIAFEVPGPAPLIGLAGLGVIEFGLLWRSRQLTAAVVVQRDEEKIQLAQSDVVIAEARHRLKNLIAIISALAKNSRRPNETRIDDFLARFLGRLYALGEAADQVLARGNENVEIRELFQATLKPFMSDKKRLLISGPHLVVKEQTGGSLALAVHELATNALKYGALSVPDGTVRLEWQVFAESDLRRVLFSWHENGGPAVRPPEREGFGSRLIRLTAAQERDAQVDLSFHADGLTCTIGFTVPA
ncbi:MAG: sensor histidine kinase, partial [Alphaproteobacteria bacterium]|nr:sensor histidine kinase [Alphaproteobacteria bacterium]